MRFLSSSDRFDKNQTTNPYVDGGIKPLPTRNIYALFGDGGHDLFRHGLAELTPLGDSDGTRLSMFKSTEDYSLNEGSGDSSTLVAREDPVMFGFDIVIRTEESPLFSNTLQDSVSNFFNSSTVAGNAEMLSREPVWQQFKGHFFQFFRDTLENKPYTESANLSNPSNSRFYYYLKKVSGLDLLVENNTGDTNKQFVDYGKEMIKLEFSEDVTLRVGKMAQLYKTLYWSRLSGKTMIPENLLRFDCDIVVSEVRNFARVQKALETGDLQVLRDNVNRYVYTLYECQLFFDKMPHPGEIDLGAIPDAYTGYSMGFNYKFSTLRLDAFNMDENKYTPLNNGTYNPFSITPFDKFLNVTSGVQGTQSSQPSIGDSTVGVTPPVEILVIKYNGDNTLPNDQNTETNSDATDKELEGTPDSGISDIEQNEQEEESIEQKKKALLDEEIKQFSDAALADPDFVVSDARWGRPSVLVAQSPFGETNAVGPTNTKKKKDILDKETDASKEGDAKESWMNSDTPGARFAKRIANAGIAVVNNAILSRAGLLNKTLNKIAGAGISNRILPPKNIYDSPFNGQVYTSSKLVKDAFTKFVGESISDLFKK